MHRSVKSLGKLNFAFRTSDDGVQQKTYSPANKEVHFCFSDAWEMIVERREGRMRGKGRTSADSSQKTPNSVGRNQYAQ
jgi:hypothetical protein